MRRVLALLFALTIIAGSAMSAQAATPQWRLQSVPSPAQGYPGFTGVSCPTTTVCVAVGSVDYFDANGHGHRILAVERWQGGRWTVQDAPAPVGKDSSLSSVSCASATSCLAVGGTIVGSNPPHLLIERYSSGQWEQIPAPAVSSPAALNSVSCSSSTICTAVGMAHVDENGNHWTPLIERYNNGTWKQQQAPQATIPATLLSISCASTSSCVAVGSQQSYMHALAIRWNGKAWTTLSVPTTVQGLHSVSCASSAICTAVAQRTAVRWAGHGPVTSAIPVPKNLSVIRTQNISCPTSNVCEVAGGYEDTGGQDHTTAARFSAGHWTRQFPDNSGFDMDFAAISCSSTVTCEAVGSMSGEGLAERYS